MFGTDQEVYERSGRLQSATPAYARCSLNSARLSVYVGIALHQKQRRADLAGQSQQHPRLLLGMRLNPSSGLLTALHLGDALGCDLERPATGDFGVFC